MDVVSSEVAIRVGWPNAVNLHAGGVWRNVDLGAGRRVRVGETRQRRRSAMQNDAIPESPAGVSESPNFRMLR